MGSFLSLHRRRLGHGPISPESEPPLPPEIVDLTLDYLSQDPQTLLACSLVCRSWVKRCRYHLFTRLALTKFPPDIAFLENSSIPQYVQQLALNHDFDTSQLTHADEDVEIFRKLKQILPDVHTLELKRPVSGAVGKIVPVFRDIPHLILDDVRFLNFTKFMYLVGSFDALETLRIERVQWDSPVRSGVFLRNLVKSQTSCIRTIAVLSVHDMSVTELSSFILPDTEEVPMTKVEVLKVTSSVYNIEHPARELITSLGPHLTGLHLDLNFHKHIRFHLSDELLNQLLPLNSCMNVKALHFDNISLIWGMTISTQTLIWIPTVLSQLNIRKLREVSFTLIIHQNDNLDAFPWRALDDVLASPGMENVQVKVHVPLSHQAVDPDKARGMIRRRLMKVWEGRRPLYIDFPISGR